MKQHEALSGAVEKSTATVHPFLLSLMELGTLFPSVSSGFGFSDVDLDCSALDLRTCHF
jgi:hypothetical protein